MKFGVSLSIRRPTGFRLDVDLDCETDALGLVGPSGSGKSTLLEAIAGIESGGRVVLDGMDCSRLPLEGRRIGYVSQEALLFPHLTVRQNLTYSPQAEDPVPIAQALGLEALLGRMPRNLSGGERRRVALGRAILARPRLLLLDEPFAGLDETLRREAMAHLDRVRREFRIPMVLVSHLSDEVAGLTDWAVRLDAGRIVHQGPSVSLLGVPGARIDNAFTATVIGPGRVRLAGLELAVLLPEGAAGAVLLAAYAHEITLADQAPAGISTRNIFPVRIARVTPAAGAVLVELEAPAFRVLVTDQARESLDLRPGTSKMALLKATSIAYLGPA